MNRERLAAWVADARERSFDMVADLSDEQLLGPRLAIVNPLLWEIGHLAWFQEKWVLRQAAGREPLRARVDSLYDSMAIPHDVRWDLPLFPRADTLAYMREVRDAVLQRIEEPGFSERDAYFVALSVFHEDMHAEAFLYTRQTHSFAPPSCASGAPRGGGPLPGDVSVPGGPFRLGAEPDSGFAFDNEKWAHEVALEPYAIARAPVTQAEFAAFVEDSGYLRRELWSAEGWRWREATAAEHPVHWRPADGGFERRVFDAWRPLEPHLPVLHVCHHEAEAYCRWAGRRLPTETEWEAAAAGCGDPGTGRLAARKSPFPWGEEPPAPERAHLDGRATGCVDVGALPEGDSALGCRQMIGNVWEWTASDFGPYPGFAPDPYKEYSVPWFGDHKVLRGGCFATRGRLLRNTWRNFYRPERRDVFAGFRTCAR